ncbi:MAG: hypothetical protein K8W52_03370 [Deltaproteobacteria bacterium]|nr:hypothetical protein [Deltaproteobacteria bacterium]
MSTWPKALALATLAVIGVGSTARAETPAQRAAALNEAGKKLSFADPPRYEEAAAKFRQAIVLSPEGRFYFNLCGALYSMGDFGNALMACQAVEGNGATPSVVENANKLTGLIKEQIRKLGQNPDAVVETGNGSGSDVGPGSGSDVGPGSGSDVGPGSGSDVGPGSGSGVGPGSGSGAPIGANPNLNQFKGAPPPSLFASKPPTHDYTYSLGGALVASSSTIGRSGAYASSATGFRLLADLMLAPSKKVGAEFYLDLLTVGEADALSSLTVFDVGAGLYKHLCKSRLCLTPMLGAHIVGYNPSLADTSTAYVSLGIRPQVSLGYAVGKRYEHLISLNLGVDLDLKPFGSYTTDPSEYYIDEGGSMVMFSLGYQYRFNTPFGQSPFFSLQ